MSRPPRLARWWLARSLREDDREELLEEFDLVFAHRRRRLGWLRAALGYWRDALRIGLADHGPALAGASVVGTLRAAATGLARAPLRSLGAVATLGTSESRSSRSPSAPRGAWRSGRCHSLSRIGSSGSDRAAA
ncbi:MAG: hypothetical protein R2909_10415 [Gemmatimonadales bacterium]